MRVLQVQTQAEAGGAQQISDMVARALHAAVQSAYAAQGAAACAD